MAPCPPYILPIPSFNFWLFFWPEIYEDQVIPHKQLLLKTNQVLTTPTEVFPFSLPPPLPSCRSPPSTPTMPSWRPLRKTRHSPSTLSTHTHETRNGLWESPGLPSGRSGLYPLSQGLRADQGHTFAYLLAEEEALGGENCEAVSGRAFGRAVGTGCLADFSLLLLIQIEESVCGCTGKDGKKCGLF